MLRGWVGRESSQRNQVAGALREGGETRAPVDKGWLWEKE